MKIEPNFVDGPHGQLQFHRCGFLIVSSIDNRSHARQHCSASPKKSEDHFDSKGEFRYAPAVGSFVIWSWDNSKIHSLIFVFEQEITVISLLSPHPKRIFILSSSKFSKQKGEDDDSQRCF